LATVGVEIQRAAVARAAALGHEVHMGPFSGTTLAADRRFEVIACLDVLEHLTISEIRKLFRNTISHLAEDGRCLLRFPNGNSPFVGPVQCSDITHRTLLSPGMVEEIARPLGLRVERTFNDRILPATFIGRCRRLLTYRLRRMIGAVIGLACFGRVLPLDPNVFVILAPAAGRE
jgi:hypothetical protein